MRIAAGIDVGGPKKGFHAVALRDGEYFQKFHSTDAAGMTAWVKRMGARAVGVDAPCRWRTGGRMRAAERELARLGIRCFATPGRKTGESNPFYAWMRNGLLLYERLSSGSAGYPVLGGAVAAGAKVCFETFPQAIACALAGRRLSGKNKRVDRRELLEAAGIDTGALTSLDFIDAALCAVAAHRYLLGEYQMIADPTEGFLIPNSGGPPAPRAAG
jgi:predicted nuclease with RNAse H fold